MRVKVAQMIKTRSQFLHRFNLGRPSPTRFKPNAEMHASAVLIPIVEGPHDLQVVFTKRSDHLRHHAGQICFPGGRRDLDDVDLKHTALREFNEEVGVNANQVEIIGQLPDMPVISRFTIRPYVGFLPKMPVWQPNPQEVEAVFTVPLHQLLHHQIHYAYRQPRFGPHPIWFIPWQQHLIWGATAGIVRSLAEQLAPQHRKLYRPLN